MDATPSTIERLAQDLRAGHVSVLYRTAAGQVACFSDFVGNYAFLGLEGVSDPVIAIRQPDWREGAEDLVIPLSAVKAIEVERVTRADPVGIPLAWWFRSFGSDLRRFSL